MESIWTRGTGMKKRRILSGDKRIHTAVIGGGLAGILTAYRLQKQGVPVIVLEANEIGSGQTKDTTAKITSQHNLMYDRLLQSFGEKLAGQYARANEKAINDYERIIKEEQISCQFTRCPSYLYSCRKTDVLKKEAEAAKKLGIYAAYEEDCELPFPVTGVTRFDNQARFHPLEFVKALSEKIAVYENTKVLRVKDHKIETEQGTVTAEKIVFATHYPFMNMPGYYFARMYQERSYVLALKNTMKLEGMYLGIDADGLSFRPQDDILLLGGGSHRTGGNREGGRYQMLRDRAVNLWPDCREIAHWSAQDCMTLDGIPYIGQFASKTPDWYVAAGFGKWGMTSSMVSARIIADTIVGRSCHNADIFSPERKITAKAVGKFFLHSLHTASGLGKRLLPAKKRKTGDGQHTVVRRCPHMGCRLEWNPEEKTYECPCHGSRFNKNGELLDNPAQADCKCRPL